MKTNLFRKANETKKNEFIEMKIDELKSIQGGTNAIIRYNPDGSIEFVYGK